MRNDKDFVIGMNTPGHAMASLFKSFNLIDTSDHEEMYWFTIFKDAVIYHLLQFHINSNHIYDFMTQIIYSQLCDHPVGSIAQFGYPDSYHRLLGLLVQSCTVLYHEDYRYNMKQHFPHLNAVRSEPTDELAKGCEDTSLCL